MYLSVSVQASGGAGAKWLYKGTTADRGGGDVAKLISLS